jgi:salicylate hydroxylase
VCLGVAKIRVAVVCVIVCCLLLFSSAAGTIIPSSVSSSTMQAALKPKRISVIGGGLGGLAFAQAMKNIPNFHVTVYERDEAAEHRSQGYQIGIHQYGKQALDTLVPKVSGIKELLLENPMNGVVLGDPNLDPYVRFPTGGASLVNRWKLRDLLKQDVNIEWNKRFSKYEETEDGVKAYFEDGSFVESDLLVAADGAKSRIRHQYRPDFRFHSTGIGAVAGFFDLETADAKRLVPKLGDMVVGNLCRIQLNHRQSLLCMRFIANDGKEQLLWAVSFDKDHGNKLFGPLPEDEHRPSATKDAIAHRVRDQCEEIKSAIQLTAPENIIIQQDYLSMIPESIKDAHKSRPSTCPATFNHVVMLGDAAHAMTTHAGLGANTAIKDAVELATIVQDPSIGLGSSQWATGHDKYEKELFQRGYKAVTTSLSNTRRIHADPSAVGAAILKTMGFCVKTYHLFTSGKFTLDPSN